MATRSPHPLATAWLAARGWKPFAFQRAVWKALAQGHSGLLHATTGAGKTYAEASPDAIAPTLAFAAGVEDTSLGCA